MASRMSNIDPRLNAIRPDLADIALEGKIDSRRFAVPRRMQILDPAADLHKAPHADAMQVTQALMGETVKVFAEEDGWAWVQLERDKYVGYVNATSLASDIVVPTHRVAVPSTFLYPRPNLKSQPAVTITMNAQVMATGDDQRFTQISNGMYIYTAHLRPVESSEADFVAVAEMFRYVPYYWGGKSARGLDCSGLVQVALEACGMGCPRDSDMQQAALGRSVMVNDLDNLARGDLVFWNGHVGIMCDQSTLLHANGHHMMVVAEPLTNAVTRIAQTYGQITSIKRL